MGAPEIGTFVIVHVQTPVEDPDPELTANDPEFWQDTEFQGQVRDRDAETGLPLISFPYVHQVSNGPIRVLSAMDMYKHKSESPEPGENYYTLMGEKG